MAGRHTPLSADDAARRSGAAEDIQAWELLIRKFDKQLAQYGRTSN